MNRRNVIAVGFLLFIGLIIICLMIHPKDIESKLAGKSTDALKSAGIEGVSVTFDGRACTLSGAVATKDQSKQAAEIIKGINGVRSVANLVNTTPPDVKAEKYSEVSQNDSIVNMKVELSEQLSGHHILFATNSSRPASQTRDVMARVAMLLKKYASPRIEIAGHTDSRGTQAYNHELSLRRAQSVKETLLEGGETADRFIIKGYGENSPVAQNSTPEGMARNRRVEFRVIKED